MDSAANKTPSKRSKAEAIVKKYNASKSTKELVSMVMTDCTMTEQGARTYVYDARQKFDLEAPPRQQAAKKAAKKADASKGKKGGTPKAKKKETKRKTNDEPPATPEANAATDSAVTKAASEINE